MLCLIQNNLLVLDMYIVQYTIDIFHVNILLIFHFQNVGYGRGATGLVLYILSFLTTVGNAMVLHAIRTERRLQTVR